MFTLVFPSYVGISHRIDFHFGIKKNVVKTIIGNYGFIFKLKLQLLTTTLVQKIKPRLVTTVLFQK